MNACLLPRAARHQRRVQRSAVCRGALFSPSGTFAITQDSGTLTVPMLTVHVGTGPWFRPGLVALLVLGGGCAGKPSLGSIEVLVNLEPGLVSRCVKVTAKDGVNEKETKAIPLAGKMSPLRIGMREDGLVSPVTVQAFGYSDEGCTILTPGEVSAAEKASYGTPTTEVTLTLAPVSNGDGGVDAGVDNDLDGYPAGVGPGLDCDDTNPNVHPNANESLSCGNGLDDDCNGLTDCADPICDGYTCGTGGSCVNRNCTVEICNDGIDNNGNGAIDCADPDCMMGTACNDNNACTTGDQCAANGTCQKTADVTCNTPPAAQCYSATGMCLADAGATCFYAPTDGGCDDTLGCTVNDSCTNGGCAGTAKTCAQAANTCLATTGSCAEPAGTCSFAPLQAGTGICSDANNCTTADTCDGNGGCAGTQVTCTANQCQTSSTGCTGPGACIFGNRNGQACDAGTGGPATCDPSFNCNATPPSLFPYTPTNFTEGQLPTDGGVAFTVSSTRTLNTSGTPSITVGAMPPFTLITQGGQSTVLVKVSSFSVASGQSLLITGSRPIIFAVLGDVVVDGIIRASNGAGSTACGNGGTGTDSGTGNGFSGGGGGGFGSAGGVGGTTGGGGTGALGAINGGPTLSPVRGGCSGGNGTSAGGAGGGALQITASGSLTVNNTLAAPGRGGVGATANGGNSGGGGGSGGGILLEGANVVISSSALLTANGGSGGEGSGGNWGFSGLDGNETSSTATPNGGDNSANGGNGGVGAAGTTAAGPGLSGSDQNDGSGGGGGGVGRIRINASTSCTIAGSGKVISPPHSSNGATGC